MYNMIFLTNKIMLIVKKICQKRKKISQDNNEKVSF